MRRYAAATRSRRKPSSTREPVAGADYVIDSLLDDELLAGTSATPTSSSTPCPRAATWRARSRAWSSDCSSSPTPRGWPRRPRRCVLPARLRGPPRLLDVHETPAEVLPEVLTGIAKLEVCRTPPSRSLVLRQPGRHLRRLDPTERPPGLPHQRRRPAQGDDGNSEISGADLALAVLDENTSRVTSAAASTWPTDPSPRPWGGAP